MKIYSRVSILQSFNINLGIFELEKNFNYLNKEINTLKLRQIQMTPASETDKENP